MIKCIYLHVYICVYTYNHSFPCLNKNEPFLEHHLPCFFFFFFFNLAYPGDHFMAV